MILRSYKDSLNNMAFIIMIGVLIIISLDGWQIQDNLILVVGIFFCYLNYKDANDKESEDYYGGY